MHRCFLRSRYSGYFYLILYSIYFNNFKLLNFTDINYYFHLINIIPIRCACLNTLFIEIMLKSCIYMCKNRIS